VSIAKQRSVKLAFGEKVRILRDVDRKTREVFLPFAHVLKKYVNYASQIFPLFVQINCAIHINRKSYVCITSFHNKNGSSTLIYFYLITVLVKFRAKQATKGLFTLFNLS
jgi:hypothetical protein